MSFYPFSKVGVDLFFVLSGFLITEILLKTKLEIVSGNKTVWKALKTFYIRRSLRIFPIYYLFISFFYLIQFPHLDKIGWVSLFTYTTNFYIYYNSWIYPLSHLWTLAVEEQYYLIWPLLIFLISTKKIRPLLLILIAFSSLFLIFNLSENVFVLPFSCFSTLAIGGAYAYLKSTSSPYYLLLKKYNWLCFGIAILALLTIVIPMPYIIKHYIIAFSSLLLINFSINVKRKWVNYFFQIRFLSYFGKISYGLYLFHHPIPWLVRNLNGTETENPIGSPIILPVFNNWWLIFMEQFVVLIVLASFTWFIIEKPINSLKKYYT